MIYANAGHPPPCLLKDDGEMSLLGRTGLPLGIFEDENWEQELITFSSGDKIVLYTDGVTDAENEKGMYYKTENLLELLDNNRGVPVQKLEKELLKALKDFMGNAPQTDDIALVILGKK